MNTYGIEKYNIMTPCHVYRNLSPAVLTEMALKTEDCKLTDKGALLVDTGKYTGRSPKDRYVVDEPTTTANINWNNENKKISEAAFDSIYGKVAAYLSNRDIYLFDGFAGRGRKSTESVSGLSTSMHRRICLCTICLSVPRSRSLRNSRNSLP